MNYASEHGIYPEKENNVFNEEIDTVHITEQISFKSLATLIDLSLDKIEKLNPSYKIGSEGYTPLYYSWFRYTQDVGVT